MEESRAIQLVNEYIDTYIPGAFFGGFMNSKRTLGMACASSVGHYIKLSKHLVKLATEDQIRNTIAHECAHILALRRFGTLKHDKYFYRMCHVTGAKAERVASDSPVSSKLEGGYRLVLVKDCIVEEILPNKYYRRPRKPLCGCWLVSRPAETKGRLYYCEAKNAVVGKHINNEFWQ